MPEKARNVAMVLLGVAVLLAKRGYRGWGETLVHNQGGNCSISFAVYFLLRRLPAPWGTRMVLTAALALSVVSLFEATDGFGVMTNTYDPWDFVANGAGVLLALGVDVVTGAKGRAKRGLT